jgi:hypothetical protein
MGRCFKGQAQAAQVDPAEPRVSRRLNQCLEQKWAMLLVGNVVAQRNRMH